MKKTIIGAITTIIIGGSAYTISQTDVINNFASDTGMTQQQAEEYVGNISESDLATYDQVGEDFINDSKDVIAASDDIDCVNYEYEWESNTLSCQEGKSQLKQIGKNEASLGRAYIKLASESASTEDITTTIKYIDILNDSYALEIVKKLMDSSAINDAKNTNSYNKSILKAALEGN